MTQEAGTRLPTIVKIAVALTFYNSFVLFEELVLDRHGLRRYLPLYRFGKFCIWDLGAIAVILIVVFGGLHLSRRIRPSR